MLQKLFWVTELQAGTAQLARKEWGVQEKFIWIAVAKIFLGINIAYPTKKTNFHLRNTYGLSKPKLHGEAGFLVHLGLNKEFVRDSGSALLHQKKHLP